MPRRDTRLKSGAPEDPPSERRQAPRYEVNLGLRYLILHPKERISETGEGRTVDLSSAGVRFMAHAPIGLGRRVRLLVDWPALFDERVQLQLVVEGVVVRSKGKATALQIQQHALKTSRHGLKSA